MREYLKKVSGRDQTVNQVFRTLGCTVEKAEEGKAILSMPIKSSLFQGGGLVAGGVLATLADECMAHAAISLRYDTVVTLEMNVRYLRSPKPVEGAVLVAKATVVKSGRTVIVAEASVYDDKGNVCATAGGTFYILKRGDE